MGKIKGWKLKRDLRDNVVYEKENTPIRLSLSKVKPNYWNINLYEKERDGFRFIENLQRGFDDKRQAKKFAINYMRSR